MKLLVTGASGFIGRNFLLSIKPEWLVTATYWKSGDFPYFVSQHNLNNVIPLRVNLSSEDEIEKIADISRGFDCCIYLAANGDPAVSTNWPAFDLVSNTLTLVKLLEKIRFDRFIYFSSGAIYDGLKGPVSPDVVIAPKLPYAISNLASESYLKHFQSVDQIQRLFIVRFFGAYGPYEPPRKIYSRLVKRFAFEHNPQFTIRGDGKNRIDAMYIDDAVRAIHLLFDSKETLATCDLYSGHSLTLTQLVVEAARVFHHIEPEIIYEGNVPEYIEFYSTDRYFSDRYGFIPTITLEEGLLGLYNHLKQGGKFV